MWVGVYCEKAKIELASKIDNLAGLSLIKYIQKLSLDKSVLLFR